jgi:hypothetical protein
LVVDSQSACWPFTTSLLTPVPPMRLFSGIRLLALGFPPPSGELLFVANHTAWFCVVSRVSHSHSQRVTERCDVVH